MDTICPFEPSPKRRRRNSGIALITTLLLMSLMVAMTLAMTIAVSSDTLITRYYRNYRAAFYAADSGANILRQYMANQIVATIPATFTNATQPIPAGTDATVQAALLTQYGSSASSSNRTITTGSAAASWPGSFYVASSPAPSLSLTSCTPQYTGTPTNAGPYTCTNVPTCSGCGVGVFNLTDFKYVYTYSLTSYGQSTASELSQINDAGTINITVNVAPAGGTTTSFAGYGMFIDQYTICDGSALVGGTISGPVFTNGSWNFGTSSYTFTDSVGSHGADFGYQFSGQCDQKSASSDKVGGTTIAPNFQSGYKLGQNTVPLPKDSFDQKRAVLDGMGTNDTDPTQSQMAMYLRSASNVPYPSSGSPPSTGVYMSYSSANQMQGGGIYVAGNADSVMLTAASASSAGNNPVTGMGPNDSLQEVTIKQGSTTTTVYLDQTNSRTYMKQGSTVTTIVGLPQTYVTTPSTPATIVYVDGNIGTSSTTGLSGPGQGVAGVQNGEAMTVSAAGNINITGDLLYKTEPINIPADTVNSANNNGQVLGIFTANGNINLDNQQSNGNLEIDASIATISNGGSGGLVNTGNAINTLTIVGGRIQNTIQNIDTTTRNVWFDRRFAQGNFAPPWFPSTTIAPLATDSATGATTTFTRTSWTAPSQ